jgi:uncharacterized protein
MEKHVTLIIKVTNACDMHCRYCFIEPSVYHKTMKLDLARKIVRTFLDSKYFSSVHFVWHGGEPLLRGPAFFEEILAEQKRMPTEVHHSNTVQTNATHLTENMLELLVANNIHIGLSLDGPAEINDKARGFQQPAAPPPRPFLSLPVVPNERMVSDSDAASRPDSPSPHDITVDAAQRLRRRGLSAGAIVVVNASNVDHPEDIYREFKKEQIHMKVNPLMKSGLAATAEGQDLGITAEQYGGFLIRLFDAWYDDPEPTIMIAPFQNHIGRMLGIPGASHECHFTKSCHLSFIGISPEGNMYPCGMFQGEPAFLYGNIEYMSPENISLTRLFGRISEREGRVLATCSECAFFELCYGGCMFHSLKNGGQFEEKDYYCAGYKMYFGHMLTRIHKDLSRAATLVSGQNEKVAAPTNSCVG